MERLSTRDVHRSRTAGATSSERAPLWAVGLYALLLILGFARRQSGDASPATRDLRPLEASRGQFAETPAEIPAKGWKDILLRVYHGISEDRILLVAAGVTFYPLLSIFLPSAVHFPRDGGSVFDIWAVRQSRGHRRSPRCAGQRRAGRSHRPASGGHDPARLEWRDDARCRLSRQPGRLVVDHQFWGQRDFRCFEHRLRRKGEAWIGQILFDHAGLYVCLHCIYSFGNCGSRASAGGVELYSAAGRNGPARKDRAVANTFRTHRVGIGGA